MATPDTIATALRQGAAELPFFRRDDGWRYGLSITPTSAGVALVMFSAQLIPEGRGSNESDWRRLGEIAGALGMPSEGTERLAEEARTGDPNRVLKTWWKEGGAS